MKEKKQLLAIFLLLIAISACASKSPNGLPSAAAEAKSLRKKKQFAEAVDVYKKHIRLRLKDKARPDFENPHFYYLLICDTYLEMSEPDKAEAAIELAAREKVDQEFIVDRLRQIIAWHESKNSLEKAHAMATKYRELSKDVFDVDIDRLNKKIVQKEESRR